MLRRQLGEFKVCLLDYCLTSNHVHLLLEAEDRLQISALMRNVAGGICPSLQSAQRATERVFGAITFMRRWWRRGGICGAAFAMWS